jgi:hypothetical protein
MAQRAGIMTKHAKMTLNYSIVECGCGDQSSLICDDVEQADAKKIPATCTHLYSKQIPATCTHL